MMVLERLCREHGEVFARTQVLEKAVLDCFEGKKRLSKEEYLAAVMPCRHLFKSGLVTHFRVEESTIFPILMAKSLPVRSVCLNLISEHLSIMQRFSEFEDIEDYDRSISTLAGLMSDLSSHAKKEDELFSSLELSRDEELRIIEVARSIGFSIQ